MGQRLATFTVSKKQIYWLCNNVGSIVDHTRENKLCFIPNGEFMMIQLVINTSPEDNKIPEAKVNESEII